MRVPLPDRLVSLGEIARIVHAFRCSVVDVERLQEERERLTVLAVLDEASESISAAIARAGRSRVAARPAPALAAWRAWEIED